MPEQAVELRQVDSLWHVTLNGQTLACAADRAGAINATAGLLRRQLKDPGFVAQVRWFGLELQELLPAKPVERSPRHSAPTTDFAGAKRLVAERCLPFAEERLGTAVRIVDELCVEYEWGWVIHWR